MTDDKQKFDYGWVIDLAIAGSLLLVCVWGAAFIAGFVWEWVK